MSSNDRDHLEYPAEMDNDLRHGDARAEPSDFADSVDPLHAAIARNEELSLLLKLPDEILLIIVQLLQSDILGFYYLRRVCRKLRRLTEDHTLRSRHLLPRGSAWGPRSYTTHSLDRFA